MGIKENVEKIHQASMEILAKTGMVFHHPDALAVLKEHGIRVEGNIAYFTEEQVMTYVKKAPAYAKLFAADPTYDMEIGGDNCYTGPAGGATFIMDKDGNTRDAVMADFLKLMKLYEGNPKFHINGGLACQPSDIPTETSTILLAFTSLLHTNKCIFTAAGSYETMETLIQLACAKFHVTPDELRQEPRIATIANTNSPLQLDTNMTETIFTMIKYGQPVVIAAAAMAGATTPITLAGTLTVANAEILATIALTQMVVPGAPVIYGSQSSATDMSNGAMAIGSPEGALCYKYCAELARFYGIPSRSGGSLTDAKSLNVQAGYESMLTTMACKQSGVNIMFQSAGIMNSYLAVSFEKVVTDFEIHNFADRYIADIVADENSIPMDVILDVGHSGKYLTNMHTFMNCRTELLVPSLSVRGVQNDPQAKLGRNIEDRIQQLVDSYVKPTIDQEALAQMIAIVQGAGIPQSFIDMVVEQ